MNSTKPQQNSSQQQQPQSQHHHNQQPPNNVGPRTLYTNRSRIAPMTSSRSEANLPASLRMPDGGHHPSLDHFGGNGSTHHLTMAKTKVWYHSQRDFQQEASV